MGRRWLAPLLCAGVAAGLAGGAGADARPTAWVLACWQPPGLEDRWCQIATRLDWKRGEQRFLGAVSLRREGDRYRLVLSGDRMIEHGQVAVDAAPPLPCLPDFDCIIAEPEARRLERALRAGKSVRVRVQPSGMPLLDFTFELNSYRAAMTRLAPPDRPW